jgi:hypothetical protein
LGDHGCFVVVGCGVGNMLTNNGKSH